MAVYTKIHNKDILYINNKFEIDKIISFKGIKQGIENTNYLLISKKNKLIFDGYPRSLSQAKNLDLLLDSSNQKIDFIFFLNANKDTIVKRIKKRKSIENRYDDEVNTTLKRYETYMETTRPVLDFYSKNSYFHEIDGSQEIDEITRKIDTFINV